MNNNHSIVRINLSSLQNEKGYLDKAYNAMCIIYQYLKKDDFVIIYIHKDKSDEEVGGSVLKVAHPDIPKVFDGMCSEWRKMYNL